MNRSRVSQISSNFEDVKEKIEKSAGKAGRNSALIKLIVVTKMHPVDVLADAVQAGIRDFGENYAEEAERKILELGSVDGLQWHMIGHVQSRKADIVARHFDFVHSVDSYKLADRLNRYALSMNKLIPVLLECNVSGEENKYGFSALDEAGMNQLLIEAERIAQMPNLSIRGLMTMPPLFDHAEKTRPFFQKLCGVQRYLSKHLPSVAWDELSMGTSSDFQVAVEEGATMVRVGTAILGARAPKGIF